MPLLEELGKRGHNVTVLTPIRPTKQTQNVKEILTIDVELMEENDTFNLLDLKQSGPQQNPFLMLEWFNEICRNSYDLEQVQSIMKEKFDLILFPPFFNDCALGLIYRMKLPVVLFFPIGVTGFILEKVGAHLPPSFNPNMLLNFPAKMTFTFFLPILVLT